MEALENLLRVGVPVILGIAAAFTLDRLCAVRGFLPPGFRVPWRRIAAGAVLAGLLALGVFGPLGSFGLDVEPDFSQIKAPQLFLLHFLMMGTLGAWFLLGYAGVATRTETDPAPAATDDFVAPAPPPPPPPSLSAQFAAQFGFRTDNVWREIGLGGALGIAAWLTVLLALIGIAGVLWALGGDDAVPQQPPAMVPFIASLPILVRVLISLSAGVVEETFFRGFLQPRIGLVLSTAFFALAHLSYGQPFMLIGITVLSLIYGLMVKWRQNIWPAVTAHVFFDAVQLLVIVPSVLRMIPGGGAKTTAVMSAVSAMSAMSAGWGIW